MVHPGRRVVSGFVFALAVIKEMAREAQDDQGEDDYTDDSKHV